MRKSVENMKSNMKQQVKNYKHENNYVENFRKFYLLTNKNDAEYAM